MAPLANRSPNMVDQVRPGKIASPDRQRRSSQSQEEPQKVATSGSPRPSHRATERKKKFAPKTRTGCLTCRARRVKCDEGKPRCRACTRGARPCHYQPDRTKHFPPRQSKWCAIELSTTSDETTPSLRSLSPRYGSSEEAFFLDKFLSVTAPWLSRYNDTGLFHSIIPQRSWYHPALRHSIVALSMATEEARLPHVTSNASRHQWHYNQALRYVYSASTVDEDVILLTSAMFLIHDNIMKNPQSAMVHFQGFLRLMTERKSKKNAAVSNDDEIESRLLRGLIFSPDPADDAVAKSMEPVIIRNIRSRLCDPKYTKRFKSMSDVCEELRIGLIAVPYSTRSKPLDDSFRQPVEVDSTLPLSAAELRVYFERWYRTFSKISTASSADRILLECHYICAAIVLQIHQLGSPSHPELSTMNDPQSTERMDYILSQFEEIDINILQQKPGTTDVELPVITPLSQLICFTNQSHIRARAFKLLRSLNRVEGLWSSDLAADMLWSSHAPESDSDPSPPPDRYCLKQEISRRFRNGKAHGTNIASKEAGFNKSSNTHLTSYRNRLQDRYSQDTEEVALEPMHIGGVGPQFYHEGDTIEFDENTVPTESMHEEGEDLMVDSEFQEASNTTSSEGLMRNGVLLSQFLPYVKTWTQNASSEMQVLAQREKWYHTTRRGS